MFPSNRPASVAAGIRILRGSRAWLLPFSRAELRRLLAAMLGAAGEDGAHLELFLADEADMERIHLESMGHPGPTNVLSFPAGPAARAHSRRDLGSLALAPSTALRECLFYGQDPAEHTLRLLAHGLAHLLGHDHSPAMFALCERLERAGRRALNADTP